MSRKRTVTKHNIVNVWLNDKHQNRRTSWHAAVSCHSILHLRDLTEAESTRKNKTRNLS